MIRSMKSTPKDPSPHILVVDDTPENLQIVGETLSLHVDCDLAFATDGYRALDSVLASPPELILLDVMMPGMDGLEVCRRLKANPATADIPVLFLTAKVESADVVAGFEAGAVDYVLKPFNPSELVARVKTQLRIRQSEMERRRLEASNRLLEKNESLGRMAAAVAHVRTRGDYSARATITTRDEVGRLAEGFNLMLAGIEQRDRQLAEQTAFQQAVLENAGVSIINTDTAGIILLMTCAPTFDPSDSAVRRAR